MNEQTGFRFYFFFVAQQPQVGQGLLVIETSLSHSDTPHLVGLLWASEKTIAENSTWQHANFTRDRHPSPQRDSNPPSQQASGCRPTLQTARPLGSAFLLLHCVEIMCMWSTVIFTVERELMQIFTGGFIFKTCLLQKPIFPQLINKLLTLYGTRKFIARHMFPDRTTPIHSTPAFVNCLPIVTT
jgi:hypothetical protein